MANVLELNDLESLERLRPLWDVLLAQTPGATFFQSLDWLKVYWRHFGAGQRLRVMVVGSPQAPGGILPLVVRQESTRVGKVRVLTYPLDEWGTFYGPISAAPSATLSAALEHALRGRRDWDFVELRWIEPEVDRGDVHDAFAAAGVSAQEATWAECPRVRLDGDWDHYWASRTSRWRNNVRRSEKRLLEQGAVEHVRYRPGGDLLGDNDPRWDLFETCQRIAAASWQGASTTGTTLSHESISAFLRDAHEVATRAGALDLNLLYVAGVPVAFNYAYCYRGNVFGLRTGFSSQREADGAGSVLQMRMIQDSFARGDRIYDLGASYLSAKRPWQNELIRSRRASYYPRGAVRPQLLRLKRWMSGWWGARPAKQFVAR